MSTFGKVVVGIIVIVAIAVGVWYAKKDSATVVPNESPAVETSGTGETSSMMIEGSAGASIDDDMVKLEGAMKSIDNDSSKVDDGLNDKPVQQTE